MVERGALHLIRRVSGADLANKWPRTNGLATAPSAMTNSRPHTMNELDGMG